MPSLDSSISPMWAFAHLWVDEPKSWVLSILGMKLLLYTPNEPVDWAEPLTLPDVNLTSPAFSKRFPAPSTLVKSESSLSKKSLIILYSFLSPN